MKPSAGAIAVDRLSAGTLRTVRRVVDLEVSPTEADVSAFVVASEIGLRNALALAQRTEPTTPVVLVRTEAYAERPADAGVVEVDGAPTSPARLGEIVEALASRFEEEKLPPFFAALHKYVARKNATFACPGHQGSHFLERHPVGRTFVDFVGRNVFDMDVPHADPLLGDMTGREGPPAEAEAHAAHVFGADRTYFVLNGTSTSNKIVASAILVPGDFVLFDRNNHKSVYHAALTLVGARPVYLETARNAFGLIGGVPAHCFEEGYVRDRLREVDPERAERDRPFRLAAFQLGTWDGTIYDVREIVDRIGHLCDYILFDSAWVGYEQFLPVLDATSPLRMELDAGSPGIVVTHSVHKQMSGFSQTSQIHVRDRHLDGEARRVADAAFNASLMIHGTTSPFYPLFASLDVNARLHGAIGREMWTSVVEAGIDVRKLIIERCRLLRPFVSPVVDGRAWETFPTSTIATDRRFFRFDPDAEWHGFEGYGGLQFLDPCKLMLVTNTAGSGRRIDTPRIPASVVAAYLREQGLVPEKSDLYSIVFLLTPGTDYAKLVRLVDCLVQFEAHHRGNAPLVDVLPSFVARDQVRHDCGLADLCTTLDRLYTEKHVARLLKDMFRREHFPKPVVSVQEAHLRLVKGDFELVPLTEARGRVAAEGALPYPPGIFCIAPGEEWEGPVYDYFRAIEDLINAAPDFAPWYHGVYTAETGAGLKRLEVRVLR